MENITNTTKYINAIKIILIVAAFSITSPLIASAQYNEVGSDVSSNYYNDLGSDYGSGYYENPIYSYNYNDIGTGYGTGYSNTYNYPSYNDIGSDVYSGYYNDAGSSVYSGSYNDVGTEVASTNNNSGTVTSGSYSGGGYSYQPTYYNYNTGSNWVTSGGFSGGYNNYTQPSVYNYPQSQTVTSGGFSGGSSNYVSPVTYYYPQSQTVTSGSYLNQTYYPAPVPNQVLAYTDTNPNVSSVYLSDVPYTGFSDYYPILIFISILVSFSAILSYIFLKRKIQSEASFVKAYANTKEINIDSNDSINSELMNQIASDNSDINMIEEYARKNKILLSSDASIKLVKLARLGQMNVSEYIKSIATGDWQAIGENQIN